MKENRLSAWGYIRSNKRKAFVLILAISLSFMAMYVIKFVLGSTGESFRPMMLENPKRVFYVDMTAESMGIDVSAYETGDELVEAAHARREEIMEKLREVEGIDGVYFNQLLTASYDGIVGGIGYEFPLLEAEQIPGFVEHMGATLIEGRMPQGEGEILVDSVVFRNNKFELDGYFLERHFGKTFTVVGVLRSDNMTCVGTPHGYTNAGWGIIVLCNEENSNAKELFAKIGVTLTDNDEIIDREQYIGFYRDEVESVVSSAMTLIIAIIILFLSVSIIVAYISFLRNRVEEYCLYMSIGYSRGNVYGMIMREIGLIFGISIISGSVIAVIVMKLLGMSMMDPIGVVYRYWYPEHLFTILAAFCAIVGILQIPIIVSINGVKTIDKMEE